MTTTREEARSQIPEISVGDHLIEKIKSCYRARVPIFIWGPPAIGKSACVKQAAESLAIHHLDVRLTQMDAAEVGGFPHIVYEKDDQLVPQYEEGARPRMQYATPMMYPTSGQGLLCMDEIAAADPLVQVAAYKFADLEDRGGNDYALPEGWSIVFASNRAEDNAHVAGVSSALRERAYQCTAVPNPESWRQWAYRARVNPMIIAFISKFPGRLYDFNPAQDEAGATPRTWHLLSNLLEHCEPDEDYIAGCVGAHVATEFGGWLEFRNAIPNPDEIIGQQEWYPNDEQMDLAYAAVSSISAHLLSLSDDEEECQQSVSDWTEYMLGWPKAFNDLLMLNISDLLNSDADMATRISRAEKSDEFFDKHKELVSKIYNADRGRK